MRKGPSNAYGGRPGQVAGAVIPPRPPNVAEGAGATRGQLFGAEPKERFLQGYLRELVEIHRDLSARASLTAEHLRVAVEQLGGDPRVTNDIMNLMSAVESGAPSSNHDHALRVVLMGRTQAGKSTLHAVLTGSDGSRIGDGRQRNTRDVEAIRCLDAPDVVLVDTPGVGAADGDEDFDMAFAEVPRADLVLWVASSEPTHLDTARALRRLAAFGKPILIALNCRAALEHPLNRERFLKDPNSVFRGRRDFLPAVHRPLVEAFGRNPEAVLVHAQAAFLARQGGSEAQVLWEGSQVDDLIAAIRAEAAAKGDQRRLLRGADQLRVPLAEFAAAVGVGLQGLDSALHRQARQRVDVERRLRRVIHQVSEELAAEFLIITQRRRQWHLSEAAVEQEDVSHAWVNEVGVMTGDIERASSEAHERLQRRLIETQGSVNEEWAHLPEPDFRMGHLPGFGSVWPNRLLKVGASVVGTVAALGLAFVSQGVAAPAVPFVKAGIAIGLSTVVKAVWDRIDEKVKGPDQVIRERRAKVEREVKRIVDRVDEHCAAYAAGVRESHLAELDRWSASEVAAWESSRRCVDRVREDAAGLVEGIARLDLMAARGLLEAAGRPRLAAGLHRAVRLPGVLIAASSAPEAYSEAVLFPVDSTVEAVTLSPDSRGGEQGDSLRMLTQLTPGRLRVERLDEAASVVTMLDDEVTPGLRRAWASALTVATGITLRIHGQLHNDHRTRSATRA